MSDNSGEKKPGQGYIYNTFGDIRYLKYAIASVSTLRRYDTSRPAVLVCDKNHKQILEDYSLTRIFTDVIVLPEENASITGFKHHVYEFMPFEENLFLDSDIAWCKNPDLLWKSFSQYEFTITGNKISDLFFGGPKGISIIGDFIFRRRNRTLKRFGLTYLSRVQSGMIYASNADTAKKVCKLAEEMMSKKSQTHFRSRKRERGRNQETCEWSLAMAMAKLKIQVHPWLNGYESPQLDFIEDYTSYDDNFFNVECLLYNDRFVYDLKGIRLKWLRKLLISALSLMPGKGDYLYTTPYCLHFGWYHQKQPFNRFADQVWNESISQVD